MLQHLSEWWPGIILGFFTINLVVWVYLLVASRRFKKRLSTYLSNLVRPFSRQTDSDPDASIDERIDAFIADIRDVIQNPHDDGEGCELYGRLITKDETRTYLKLHRFEIWYSFCRTGIEVFPLLGIVGTVLAIWAGLSASGSSDPDKISRVVQNFGESVRSTAYGLGAAISFMSLNSFVEPGFERLLAYGSAVRDVVGEAKQQLGIGAAAEVGESS